MVSFRTQFFKECWGMYLLFSVCREFPVVLIIIKKNAISKTFDDIWENLTVDLILDNMARLLTIWYIFSIWYVVKFLGSACRKYWVNSHIIPRFLSKRFRFMFIYVCECVYIYIYVCVCVCVCVCVFKSTLEQC